MVLHRLALARDRAFAVMQTSAPGGGSQTLHGLRFLACRVRFATLTPLGGGLDWRPRLVCQALSGGFEYQPRDDLRMAER
jgi:hypothetical protein